MQRMLSYIRKAVDDYNMIEDGDKIAVGLSGGKDSITLLMGLKALQKFYEKKFEVVAIREGCNKIALGHNEDDVLETFMLNLLYTGSINTFAPMSYMDRSKMTLIRPLIYAPEKSIKTFVKKQGIEIMPKCCPMDGVSKREDMKNLIYSLQKDIPNVKTNIYGAIKRSTIKGWRK